MLVYDTQVERVIKMVTSAVAAGHFRQSKIYLSPKMVVKATRHGKKFTKRDRTRQVFVTVGAPNYAERTFLAKHKPKLDEFPLTQVFE